MGEKYLGCVVSIDCGEKLGYFQGQVCKINPVNQTLTLKEVFHNGIRSSVQDVTLQAKDMINLSILSSPIDEKPRKPEASRGQRNESPRVKMSNVRDSPRKFISYHDVQSSIAPDSPNKSRKNRGKNPGKDDVCFVANVDLDEDFDFETNLALFDKKAVMGEIEASKQGPGLSSIKSVPNFRHDENVLETSPPIYRQIQLPYPSEKEFITDSGLIVPSINAPLRTVLIETMEKLGLTIERRSELMARGITEVALHLVGGPHRLTPKNSHQKPLVVFLCGSHLEAVGAVCAARHMASLGIQTILYFQTLLLPSYLKKEIELYKLSGNSIITNEQSLPTDTVDLILACLLPPTYKGGDGSRIREVIEWANRQQAPTMAIEQPPCSSLDILPWLQIKCSLTADLPLPYGKNDGKLYLYSLSTPRQVFQSMGIDYNSPFGSKFVITLHESC